MTFIMMLWDIYRAEFIIMNYVLCDNEYNKQE